MLGNGAQAFPRGGWGGGGLRLAIWHGHRDSLECIDLHEACLGQQGACVEEALYVQLPHALQPACKVAWWWGFCMHAHVVRGGGWGRGGRSLPCRSHYSFLAAGMFDYIQSVPTYYPVPVGEGCEAAWLGSVKSS